MARTSAGTFNACFRRVKIRYLAKLSGSAFLSLIAELFFGECRFGIAYVPFALLGGCSGRSAQRPILYKDPFGDFAKQFEHLLLGTTRKGHCCTVRQDL